MNIIDRLKELAKAANEKGIPVPLAHDPSKGGPSITFTFYYISGWLAIISLIGKFTRVFGEIDTSGSIYLFLTAAGLYLGRRLQTNGKEATIDKEEK